MSYSFSVRGASKAEASEKVAAELAKVVTSQPMHTADYLQAQAAADSFIGLLRDDATSDIAVSVSGSLWKTDSGLNQASVNVSASLCTRA